MTIRSSAPPRTEALHVLLEASSLLLHASGEEELLSQTLDLASGLLAADAYAVWREQEDGTTWRTIAQRGLSEDYPTKVSKIPGTAPRNVWTIVDMRTDPRSVFSVDVYQAEGIHSGMVVPWMLGSAIDGLIIYYWRSPRQFTQDDVDYAVALSNLSAAALNRLELREENAREQRRLAFLAEASTLLASSLDYESTLERVANLAVSQIAEWCTVHVVEHGSASRLVVAHADPEMLALSEEYSRRYPEVIVPDRGLGRVLRTGEPEVYEQISEEMIAAAAQDEEHRSLLQRFRLSASIVVPLIAHGRTLGAIRLLGTNGHHFGSGDLQLALDLGRRAAAAIENAQLHRAVLEQEAELRQSHAAAKMGSWAWDVERNKLHWSAEFKALHGLPEDAEGDIEVSYMLVHPEDREESKRSFWAVIESDAPVFHSEHRSITPDGRVLWLQVRGRIRRNAAGKATWIAGLMIDVTDSRLAEQALRRTEKLAAAGRLAATVAHEVNNPLESLVNLIYLAQRAEGLPDDAAAHLRMADDELRRIAHIVRQTLGFYREPAVPTRTGMRKLVAEVLELYRSRGASRGLMLRALEELGEEVLVEVIAGEIKQVVANLIANAIDATPVGGTVEASVRELDGSVEIAVSDTGCGIPEASRRHLFEPFFTTKADVGTGLGLWVSKGIVTKHGGTISVDEGGGPGTTVRVRLPLQSAGDRTGF